MALAIYTRGKVQGKGWRYKSVKEARGVKTSGLHGPFYIRPTLADGAQPWVKLDAEGFDQAKRERDKKERGEGIAAENNAGRTLIADAVSKFMEDTRRETTG